MVCGCGLYYDMFWNSTDISEDTDLEVWVHIQSVAPIWNNLQWCMTTTAWIMSADHTLHNFSLFFIYDWLLGISLIFVFIKDQIYHIHHYMYKYGIVHISFNLLLQVLYQNIYVSTSTESFLSFKEQYRDWGNTLLHAYICIVFRGYG